MHRGALRLVIAAAALALAPHARAETWIAEPNTAVPMRDGVILRAQVRRPSVGGPFPVLVYRTPYGKDATLENYTTFRHALERGYAIVVQDVRGRYASAGEFVPYRNEGQDGYDTIEWAARQPWSNGKVGTFGLSYPGAVQWLAAVEGPPHLLAMVPAMTFSSPQNFFYAGGPFDLSWIEWIWDNIAPDIRAKRGLPGPTSTAAAAAAWQERGLAMENVLPLEALGDLKDVAPYYDEWLHHPLEDPWWSWADLRGKYGRTAAAVLNLSGWYDEHYGPEGATTNYRGLIEARGAATRTTALVIGPWVHGVQSTQTPRAGERAFAAAAAIDYDALVLDWMDHYLRGVDNGVERRPRVRYYVMGADVWRESEQWPPPAVPTAYYLGPAAPGRPGLLGRRPTHGVRFSAFVSDPAHPVADAFAEAAGAHDYRDLARRADLLTFETAPLPGSLEVTGPIEADLFMSCDCRDADLWARLYDVDPQGRAFNLMSPGNDVARASYRDPARGRRLLEPGAITELKIRGALTSNLFAPGHRIRVQVSGSFMPIFSRNLQSGALETVDGRTHRATIRLYHDAAHASRIVLPVAGPGAAR